MNLCQLTVALISCIAATNLRGAEREVSSYRILRATGCLTIDGCLGESAWQAATVAGSFQFPWHTVGKQEQTQARLLWDDQFLYVAYVCEDEHISAKFTNRDEAVWQDDCVELFTAPNPNRPEDYFNFEMNALGTLLDQHHPTGRYSGLKREWNSNGVQIATRVYGTLNDDSDSDACWVLEAAIPLANFAGVVEHLPPRPGDVWRLNLNRCGGETNPQFSQWSSAATSQPDFHRPESFGEVVFSEITADSGLRPRRFARFRRRR